MVSLMKDISFLQEINTLVSVVVNQKIRFYRRTISFIAVTAVRIELIILLQFVQIVIHQRTIKKVEYFINGKYPNAVITYGSKTTPKRKEMGLDKTHYNDAIVISGVCKINENSEEWLLIKQFRKKKRSLHEATARKGRKIPNRNQVRNSKNTPCYQGFFLNDKVSVLGKSGYITGFTSNGAYIKDNANNYITLPNKTYKQVGISKLRLEHHNNNWQYMVKTAV